MKKYWHMFKVVTGLPHLQIQMDTTSEEGKRMYAYYTKRHPKLPFFRNKSIGVGIIDLNKFSSTENYLKSVNGKNSAAYYARKAEKAGFNFRAIDPDVYADQIHSIHLSTDERQGKPLAAMYLKVIRTYPKNSNNSYYGLFYNDRLVAYLWMVRSGELITLNRLMGHADFLKEGIMYQLVTGGIGEVIGLADRPKYVMYDTILGASDGLQLFKKRLGFIPYRIKWLKSN